MSTAPVIADLGFLVVEDQGFQRWTVATILRRLGALRVFAAEDGRSALDVMEKLQQPIDIIVTDLDMPGMDGMEFIRHIGETYDRVSLIVSSGLDRPLVDSVETMASAYGLNLLGTLEKPVSANKLESLILRHRTRGPIVARGDEAARFTPEEIIAGFRAGQFEPHFQPKVSVQSGQLLGAEALARWRHPERGVVPPHAFVGQLEVANELGELMDQMLRKALITCRPWLRAQFQASVAVNLSLTSLSDVTLADRMVRTVAELGVEPRNVVFEVTESAAASDVGRSLENLLRLRMKGFGLSIDDYGTGYSSMQQLTRIAFTELKIDQSFVMNASVQESSAVILESSLDMAKRLHIKAVAEGVETREDYELLRRLGCDLAQGYLIAQPMEADSYLAWAKDWKGLSAVR